MIQLVFGQQNVMSMLLRRIFMNIWNIYNVLVAATKMNVNSSEFIIISCDFSCFWPFKSHLKILL